jgi:hypothetical protein
MKPAVAFLVKNGIGYGHLRRALILAEALHADAAVRPIIISQANTVDLFCSTSVPVVNFPLIQHLPNDIAADWYSEVLDQLLTRIDPALVVEDTYPDPRYLSLPALQDRPRALILRRLDGMSFDTIRTSGRFAAYSTIIIAQDREAFAQEGHSGASLTAVEHSGRFRFAGPVHHTPDPAKVAAIRARLCADAGKLIVVSAGAGGDQTPDGYGDRLFHACDQVADRLDRDNIAVHVVMVTGPYYAGRALTERQHLTVRRFDPHLAELLAAADVAIIKPGHNGLSEALSGGAHLILVPDVSFMEGLDEHSKRVVDHYGGAIACPDADSLEPLVRAALDQPARTRRLPGSHAAIGQIVRALTELANHADNAVPGRQLLLLLRAPDGTPPSALRAQLPGPLSGAVVIDDDLPRLSMIEAGHAAAAGGVLIDAVPRMVDARPLLAAGTRLAIGRPDDAAFRRWTNLPVPGPALLTAYTSTVRADARRPQRALRHLQDATTRAEPAVVELDLRPITDGEELHAYLSALAAWLHQQPVQPASVPHVTTLLAERLLDTP